MNDAFGDPRNYDPNDQGFNPYEYDPTWGAPPPANLFVAPTVDPRWQQVGDLYGEALNPTINATTATTPTGGATRAPNAGPDGSTEPNMDPPGVRGGYWMGGQWVQGERVDSGPPPTPFDPIPDTSGGEGDFDPSTFQWTPFNPSPYGGYQEFQANPFLAPDPQQIASDPYLDFALKKGTQQLENSAAYAGMVRSGMNKKNVLEHGVNFTRQFGNDVWNRALQGWQANEDNRFRAWGGNRQNSMDTYNTNYRGQADSFNATRDAEKMDFNARLQQWRDRLNATTQVATAGLGG